MYIGNPIYQVAFLTDQFSGNGGTTFTMSVAPANTASVLVAVSGVLQDPSTYSVVGTTLTFSSAPPVGTGNISARYLGIPASNVTTTAYRTVTEFIATASQTTFTPPSYTVGFINVYRNGVRLGSADYTATNGTTVVLASGAASGDLVAIESFLVSSVLNAIPNTAGSVGQSNLAGNVGATGPAFSAYGNSNQTLTSGTWTKVQLNATLFDTNSNFNTSTYRFTPTVAGYYQISGNAGNYSTSSVLTTAQTSIYKNGSQLYTTAMVTATTVTLNATVNGLVYMNGSTDYLELWGYVTASAGALFASNSGTTMYMTGFLARSA